MSKDPYESLCKYYEFMLGKIPRRDEFKRHLQEMITPEELAVFFKMPFSGSINHGKLRKKVNMPEERLQEILKRLAPEGFIQAYDTDQGRMYERGNVAFMTEQQVRKDIDTPRRQFLAELFNLIIEGETADIPNKTPYYRVIPVESTLVGPQEGIQIAMDVVVPDQREVLPIEMVSEIVKSVSPIGVAQCYCRKAKRVVGEGCDHTLETCFVFAGIGQSLIESGIAREISYDEAMGILRECERQGLVHQVDNAKEITSICNCCSCCCVILKSRTRGHRNTGGHSRYVAAYDIVKCTLAQTCVQTCPTDSISIVDTKVSINSDTCIGCGQCVSVCPEGALRLELRSKQPFIAESHDKLMGKIGREAMIGLAVRKVLRR